MVEMYSAVVTAKNSPVRGDKNAPGIGRIEGDLGDAPAHHRRADGTGGQTFERGLGDGGVSGKREAGAQSEQAKHP